MARILGVDYGTVRIGIALSDPLKMLATPHCQLDAQGPEKDAKQLADLCVTQDVEKIILGWPLNMDGTPGSLTKQISKLMEFLKPQISVPLETWDERMTTITAEQGLIQGGAKRKRRKELVDQVAAQIMLQHYLDSHEDDFGF